MLLATHSCPHPRSCLYRSVASVFITFAATFVFIAICFGAATTSNRSAAPNNPAQVLRHPRRQVLADPFRLGKAVRTLDCGESLDEAKALGCIFDPLSFSWTPAPCYDAELTTAYKGEMDWAGYREPNSTEVLSEEEMSHSNLPLPTYYTQRREHLIHCAYMWRRQHKFFMNGGLYLDRLGRSYEHTMHCSRILIDAAAGPGWGDLNLTDSPTYVFFATCAVTEDDVLTPF